MNFNGTLLPADVLSFIITLRASLSLHKAFIFEQIVIFILNFERPMLEDNFDISEIRKTIEI